MSFITEVVMNNCSDVYHYLLNKIRYIERNQTDVQEKSLILRDMKDANNGQQITVCSLTNPRIHELNSKLLNMIK